LQTLSSNPELALLEGEEIRNLTASWEMRFSQLQEFKEKHGHCNLLEIQILNLQLAKWIQAQAIAKHKGKLSHQRQVRLEEIGIKWKNIKTIPGWEKQFHQLEIYKRKYGHCDVSQYDKEFPGLGRWVLKQRVNRNKGELSAERIQRLEDLSFCWNVRDVKWEQKIQDLILFKIQHGHCNVPRRGEANRDLGTWVFYLKQSYKLKKEGILTIERVRELEELGFIWEPLEDKWLDSLNKLKEFKNINGHFYVPRKEPFLALSRWLDRQRQAFKKGAIMEQRLNLLNGLGNDWL